MSDSCDPMDCSWPGSSVCGIFPARILEWAAISSSRGSSQPRDQIWVSCTAGRFFTGWGSREAHVYICTCIYPPIYLYQYWCLFHTLDYGISRQFLYHERIWLPPREAKPNVILFILLLSSLLSGPQGWSGLEWMESPTPIWGRSQVKSFFFCIPSCCDGEDAELCHSDLFIFLVLPRSGENPSQILMGSWPWRPWVVLALKGDDSLGSPLRLGPHDFSPTC